MIILAAKILFVFLIVKSVASFFDYAYKTPPKETARTLYNLTVKKRKLLEVASDEMVRPLQKLLEPFIRLDRVKKIKLKQNLARAEIQGEPEEYYAKALAMAILTMPLPIFLYLAGFKALAPFGLALLPMVFMHFGSLHKEKLKKKKQQIEVGLPHFIRAILYKLSDRDSGVVKADLIGIFEDYLKIASPVFAYDISILLIEMKAMDIENGLRNFNRRLGIPEISFLCNALIGITRGEHHNETLASLAREMDIKTKENIRRELEKRPGKVFRACIPLFLVAAIAIFYVLGYALLSGFASVV